MASLLYLLTKFLRGAQDAFPYDTEVFCVLLALEGPGYLRAWLLSRR